MFRYLAPNFGLFGDYHRLECDGVFVEGEVTDELSQAVVLERYASELGIKLMQG